MNPNDFQRAFGNHGDYDFAPGSVFGARWWSLTYYGELRGVYAPWTPGENVAVCRAQRRAGSFRFGGAEPELEHAPVPDEDCTCGFYAFWKPDERINLDGTSRVLGVVEGFGRTLIGERGFRCEKARIVALHVPTDPFGLANLADIAVVEEALITRYQVPVYATKRLMLIKHPLTTEYAA